MIEVCILTTSNVNMKNIVATIWSQTKIQLPTVQFLLAENFILSFTLLFRVLCSGSQGDVVGHFG